MFNPRGLFYIDLMGNLLSNQKLSFYETLKEDGFFSKIFSEGNKAAAREALLASYDIVKSLYDDMLAPYRWHQLGHVKHLNELDKVDYKQLGQELVDLRELPLGPQNQRYKNMEHVFGQVVGPSFVHSHFVEVAAVWFFRMDSADYHDALKGVTEK